MRIANVFILSLLVGCTTSMSPDTSQDGGVLVSDAGPNDTADVSPDVASNRDAGPGFDDAGPTCAGLPHGPVALEVTSSECEGPFTLATEFLGNMSESGSTCVLGNGTLRVVCNHTYTDLPLWVGSMMRVGTTYTSEDTFLGCEGVTYMCHVRFDALSSTRMVECSLDAGRSWCAINLE